MSTCVTHLEQIIFYYLVANAPSTQLPSPLQPCTAGGQQPRKSHSLGSCPSSHFSSAFSLTVLVHCIPLKFFQDSLATLPQICCSQLKSATVSLRRTPVSSALLLLTSPSHFRCLYDSSVCPLYICPAEGFNNFIS